MFFGKKNKSGNLAVNLSYIDGIEGYTRSTAVEVSMDDEKQCLSIKTRALRKPTIYLKYEQIINIGVASEKDIIEKSKSVAGRAVLGGVLLGPLGLIVGGMSGIGNKQKQQMHYYMIVNYISNEAETKVLSFEIVGATMHLSSFVKELRSKINTQNEYEERFL